MKPGAWRPRCIFKVPETEQDAKYTIVYNHVHYECEGEKYDLLLHHGADKIPEHHNFPSKKEGGKKDAPIREKPGQTKFTLRNFL